MDTEDRTSGGVLQKIDSSGVSFLLLPPFLSFLNQNAEMMVGGAAAIWDDEKT